MVQSIRALLCDKAEFAVKQGVNVELSTLPKYLRSATMTALRLLQGRIISKKMKGFA